MTTILEFEWAIPHHSGSGRGSAKRFLCHQNLLNNSQLFINLSISIPFAAMDVSHPCDCLYAEFESTIPNNVLTLLVARSATHYNFFMIKDFRHKGLKRFFETGSKKGIQADHVRRLSHQLSALDEAETVSDMDQPGWKLHPLKGEMDGHWSVKVSGNWRMTFVFENGDAYVVDYQDYH